VQYHPCPAISFECADQDAVVRPVRNTTSAADPHLHRVLPSPEARVRADYLTIIVLFAAPWLAAPRFAYLFQYCPLVLPGVPGDDDHSSAVDRAASLTARLHRFNDVEIRGKLIESFLWQLPRSGQVRVLDCDDNDGEQGEKQRQHTAKTRIPRARLRGAVVGSLGTGFTIWDAMVRAVAIASPLGISTTRSCPPCNQTLELGPGRMINGQTPASRLP